MDVCQFNPIFISDSVFEREADQTLPRKNSRERTSTSYTAQNAMAFSRPFSTGSADSANTLRAHALVRGRCAGASDCERGPPPQALVSEAVLVCSLAALGFSEMCLSILDLCISQLQRESWYSSKVRACCINIAHHHGHRETHIKGAWFRDDVMSRGCK